MRTEIDCAEARSAWFAMARRIYLDDGQPHYPTDLEIGWHLGACETEPCEELRLVYFTVLRPSRAEDSRQLAAFLDELETEILPGT